LGGNVRWMGRKGRETLDIKVGGLKMFCQNSGFTRAGGNTAGEKFVVRSDRGRGGASFGGFFFWGGGVRRALIGKKTTLGKREGVEERRPARRRNHSGRKKKGGHDLLKKGCDWGRSQEKKGLKSRDCSFVKTFKYGGNRWGREVGGAGKRKMGREKAEKRSDRNHRKNDCPRRSAGMAMSEE